ncbi:MAG: hypothetical protein IKC97_01730 [Clostridia bacterium]|nr:hypothetical protein [Clostridia bacterium]
MSVEYVRKKDVESLIKAYFKTKIEDGEKALDPGDTGVELLRLLDTKEKLVQMYDKDTIIRALCEVSCPGEEGGASCPERKSGRCRKIDGLEWCMVDRIAEALLCVPVGDWISSELMPPEEMGQVLALVCGKYKNITFDHAVLLGEYVDGEWILDQYPEAMDITVSHWAFPPDLPAEVKK